MKIEIRTDNEAFSDDNENYEIARILHKLAMDLENGTRPNFVMDINGNKVGKVTY